MRKISMAAQAVTRADRTRNAKVPWTWRWVYTAK